MKLGDRPGQTLPWHLPGQRDNTLNLDFWLPERGDNAFTSYKPSVSGPLLGKPQQTHTHPFPPSHLPAQTDESEPGAEGPKAAQAGTRRPGQAWLTVRHGGHGGGVPEALVYSKDLSPCFHSQAHSAGERDFLSLPLPPLIKNYKCLIKS